MHISESRFRISVCGDVRAGSSARLSSPQASTPVGAADRPARISAIRNPKSARAHVRVVALAVACLFIEAGNAWASDGAASFAGVARDAQAKVVKLYGAGGVRGLEAYQSGLLISDQGHVLTVWSYVLDADEVTVVLDDGRRFEAEHVGADPLTEIAVLKFDAADGPLPYFDLAQAAAAEPGDRVLAFSNLFNIASGDEPVSMLHGIVSAIAPLEARRGAFATNYRGDVYVVDAAANNPGAAGGALTNSKGQLLGMLGKELRSSLTGTWLNYALPTGAFARAADDIMAGRFTPPKLSEADRPDEPLSLGALGIVLVPDVVIRTPPYVDRIVPESAAAEAGLKPDDLLMMIDTFPATSCREAAEIIGRYERDAEVRIAVLRDDAFLEFTLKTSANSMPHEEPASAEE